MISQQKLDASLLTKAQFEQSLYLFSLSTQMRLLFFSDKRLFHSIFLLNQSSVKSLAYFQSREGTGEDFQELLTINQNDGWVHASFKRSELDLKLEPEQLAYDGLSVQFQLYMDLRENPQQRRITYAILEPFGLMERTFIFVEQKRMSFNFNSGVKELSVLVYQVEREQAKHKTLMYFAQDLGYLPVMLEHFSNGERKFKAVLIDYNL